MRETVVLVPIKEHSSRLSSKNTLPFLGATRLYEVTLELCARLGKRVIVSSDSDEVLINAKKLGLEIHERDIASTRVDSPISQLVSQIKEDRLACEDLMLLEVTSPLRHISLIKSAIAYLESSDYEFAFSCQYFNAPPHKAMQVVEDNGRKAIEGTFWDASRHYSQNHELQRSVSFNGLFYYYRSHLLASLPAPSNIIVDYACGALLTKRVIDIDNEDDFIEARFLYEHGYMAQSFEDLTASS